MSKKCNHDELLIRIDERVRVIQKDLSEIDKKYAKHVEESILAFKGIYETLSIFQNHNKRIRTLERRGVGYRVGSWVNGFINGVLGFRK